VDQGGIGGSETCSVYVAREFVRKGWKAIVFGDCAGLEKNYDGVLYMDHSKFGGFIAKHKIDFFVSSRRPEVFAQPIQATRKAVWVHDVWLDVNRDANLNVDKVDKVFLLSPWHKKFFLGYHKGVPEEKIHVTRDGIDLSRFEGKPRKIPGRIVYSSSPDRGLEMLLDLLPMIQKEVPEAEVHIFYGFENWEKSARANNNQGQIALIEKLKKKFGEPGICYRGRVGQKTLAREFMKAELWAYPTWFTETFCITACEAMASGTPVVTTNIGALETTVGEAGVILDVPKNQWDCGLTGDPGFQQKFVEECVRMLTDRARWEEYSQKGLKKAQQFGWDGIVEDWLAAVSFPVEEPVGVAK
jgi:glycosyltransferase involved in cell wall biosynthesis